MPQKYAIGSFWYEFRVLDFVSVLVLHPSRIGAFEVFPVLMLELGP
jgi:hypothetical protein